MEDPIIKDNEAAKAVATQCRKWNSNAEYSRNARSMETSWRRCFS